MIDIGACPAIICRIGLTGSAVVRVGVTKNLDQPVVEIRLTVFNVALEVGQRVLLSSEKHGAIIGMVEYRNGIVHSLYSPVVYLLEMSLSVG